MRLFKYLIFLFCIASFPGCKPGEIKNDSQIKPVLSPQQQIKINVDSLKKSAREGDLIVRLGDDYISDRIKYLSENDKSYSHAGVIIFKDNLLYVCHIYPDDVKGADTIRYELLDSFIKPRTNMNCALYRYDLSDIERHAFIDKLSEFHNQKIHFDRVYDTSTDNYLYCSEMIYKALKFSTNNRITCKLTLIPKNMLPLMRIYFKKYKPRKNEIEERPFMAIDNLYNLPACRLILKTPVKYMP
ncbi:MAG: hypothetical protein H0W12_06220 [Chitinophagaceae bacterium]|nr:hypothetical protein [Chitinophagaceae bacterium]